jgi:redox-sensitive bicupin YhaK (pirin superfamily)
MSKKVLKIQRGDTPHWVGDGFPVRTYFSYNDVARYISPFLLLDYAGPTTFEPTNERRGVGLHPHRGFETVTIVYEGQVDHRDSAGGGGSITKGDVQWMTAGSGVVHEEFHGKDFAKKGGAFEMIQLWVNLAKKDKMTAPAYQSIRNQNIPTVDLSNNQGYVRVIAGEFKNNQGPARTFSRVNLWDIHLQEGANTTLTVPNGDTALLFCLRGQAQLDAESQIHQAEIAFLDPAGDTITIEAKSETILLFMGGQPLNEPMFGMGPFVMSTPQEVQQAMEDFRSGKMGTLEPIKS